MIAVDTSVVVAGFASWHEGHQSAAAALARKPRVPAHVLVEAHSVLTRLPPPHRAPADLVATFLSERFPEAPLVLPARAHLALVETSARTGLAGGGNLRCPHRRDSTTCGSEAPPRGTSEPVPSTTA